MKVSTIAASAAITTALTVIVALPVLAAEEPHTTIQKAVQNQTTNSALSNADDAAGAITVKTGDIVRYVITITNSAETIDGSRNDLSSGKLTDLLPTGVELISSTKREVIEDFGTLKPGKTATKQFLVKVTASEPGQVITNKACFTGIYDDTDKAVNDCDSAVIKVAGETTPTPTPTAPEPPKQQTPTPAPSAPAPASTDLPTTGPSLGLSALFVVLVAGCAYAARMLSLTRAQ